MIGYLRGEILDFSDGKLLLGISPDAHGGVVGYAVTVPQSPAYLGAASGKRVELFVHTHVREDALDLYGFGSKVEKEIFLALLSVTGIGPKGAMGILSKVDPNDLVEAILNGDREALSRIPGIGKKTAERVVLELGDSIRKKVSSGVWGGFSEGSGKKNLEGASVGLRAKGVNSPVFSEAKAALISLGYRDQEVASLLQQVVAQAEVPHSRTEDLVKDALRQLI